ncbi:diaminobutyrate--2-oxoglutarate transaminase family protein [Thauera sinica]|uniref:Diaminobutyrate--2-oxoglutarate transaminase family protein n=1 Tax=Thauera sinica TaxID=2665146 RepID=A0ABW1AMD5_9RHOO|nr:diaminobutyrate--2-oxoglutarate transaminase family protein [Thauera sp. K11]ATE59258.1 diaminobutyrate--2-oxoglutarate transaminase [Thauera sp. K11]
MHRYEALRSLESNARTYAATFEQVFEYGHGMRLRDSAGREIIDCLACAGALPLGHNHPEVRDAIIEFMHSGHVHQALDLTTPAKYEFVEKLFSLLPPNFASKAKIQFCGPSGSDAVEAAMKLVRHATQRHPIIAFHGAYHGMTSGALAAMGNLGPKIHAGPNASIGIHFAPFPYTYRCPFGTDGSQTEELSLNYLETMLSDPESGITKPAAVIVEVVQGEGGCIPVSDAWLRALRAITQEHDVRLIIDEVQSGFGRTGTMFAFERAGIVPDVLVLSKALGGGFPLAAVVYGRDLDVWPRGTHAGTFRGNQIAMVSGRKAMEIIVRDRLQENAAQMGALLMNGLRSIAARFPVLGDVRGRGLMIGVEVIKPSDELIAGPQDGNMARDIKLAAFERGLLLETGGRHGAVLRMLPPLIVTANDVAEVLERFEDAVAEAFAASERVGSPA